ncbi:UbiD family decarboxylase domain-containing protein [Planctomicrobium sp. SH661]|uniref:UbiD family decarboxylase domain-containing protein n=1 Tax=Planctomicrobium sp. SH661 TaxID=3448124 RepID=UPI003F5C759D
MPFDDLTRFLQAASDAGELERISVPLQPDQEIAALTHQICREFRDQSPVILFEHPAEGTMPVVTNLLGNRARFLRALGVDRFEDVIERLRVGLNPIQQTRDTKFGFGLATGGDRGRVSPRNLRRGSSQQVVKLGKEMNLREFPVLRNWAGESGPIITAGQVITESVDGRTAIEQIPIEILSSQTVQLHWSVSGPTHRHWQERQSEQRPCPVAISLGGDPLLSYVAALPLPGWIDPWFFAGLLRNEGFNLVRGRSVELNVPADAEIVLEGYLAPAARLGTGVSAGPTGVQQTSTGLPSLNLSAITHRANPVFPARIQSLEVGEDLVCSQLTELILLSVLRLSNDTVVDLHLPACGGHRDVVFVSTSAATPALIQQLYFSLRSLPLVSTAGIVVIVGPDVDLRDTDAVWREVSLTRQTSPAEARPVTGDDKTLLLDATPASRESMLQLRCQPSAEILAVLARRFGNSGGEDRETAVQEFSAVEPSSAFEDHATG